MKDKRAFFDSSALVPCLIHQDVSVRMRQLLRQHPKPMVCWFTVVEINSALARLVRVVPKVLLVPLVRSVPKVRRAIQVPLALQVPLVRLAQLIRKAQLAPVSS